MNRLRLIPAVLLTSVAALLLWRFWPISQKAEQASASTANKISATEESKRPPNRVQLSAKAIARGKIEIGDVITQTIHQSLDVPGRLSLNEDSAVRIGTIVMGRVTRVLAMVGDSVKKGQSLVYIHSHELVDARAAEAKARAMVTEKEKALAYAKAELERAVRLLEAKAIAKREHALAAANVNAAAAELDQAKAEIIRASEFLEHLTVPHDSHDDIVAYSPISGIVIKRNVSVGTVVSEATDLMMVADLSTLWAIAEVPERQAAAVRIGHPVEIELQAFDGSRFAGRVVHIGDTLDPRTRTIQVRCLVQNPRGNLRPEMFATIKINNGAAQSALSVPRSALIEVEKETVVFIALDEGKFEKRLVQTGREQGGWVEIINGLKPGERIVTSGAFFIKTAFLKGSLAEE